MDRLSRLLPKIKCFGSDYQTEQTLLMQNTVDPDYTVPFQKEILF